MAGIQEHMGNFNREMETVRKYEMELSEIKI